MLLDTAPLILDEAMGHLKEKSSLIPATVGEAESILGLSQRPLSHVKKYSPTQSGRSLHYDTGGLYHPVRWANSATNSMEMLPVEWTKSDH